MKLTKAHWTGVGLSVPSVLGGLTTALTFITHHVTATADTVCVSGLPPAVVALAAGLATVSGVIGAYILLISPSAKSPPKGGTRGGGLSLDSDPEATLPGGRIPSGPPERNVSSLQRQPLGGRYELAALSNRRFALSILSGLLALPFAGIMLLSGSGCTPPQWQIFVDSATKLLQYVQLFLTGAEAVWHVIVPLIAVADRPKAEAAFQNSFQTWVATA